MAVTYTSIELGTVVPPRDPGLLSRLKDFLSGHRGQATLTAPDGTTAEVPGEVYEVLSQAVEALSGGSAVALTRLSDRLSTTQAAEVLGVSRPTLIKLLEDGKLPFERINVHRTLGLADVLAFKRSRQLQTRVILDELTRQGVEDGLYNESYEDYAEALQAVRHRKSR
jgi:excisionase family DNA binding protein